MMTCFSADGDDNMPHYGNYGNVMVPKVLSYGVVDVVDIDLEAPSS